MEVELPPAQDFFPSLPAPNRKELQAREQRGAMNARLLAGLFLISLVAFASSARAQVYFWRDAKGAHYSDRCPTGVECKVKKVLMGPSTTGGVPVQPSSAPSSNYSFSGASPSPSASVPSPSDISAGASSSPGGAAGGGGGGGGGGSAGGGSLSPLKSPGSASTANATPASTPSAARSTSAAPASTTTTAATPPAPANPPSAATPVAPAPAPSPPVAVAPPPPDPRLRSARPYYNTGTGFFIGTNKTLYDANGFPFYMKGINQVHYDSGSGTVIANTRANAVRLALYWDNGTTAAQFVTQLTSEEHDHSVVAIPGIWTTSSAYGHADVTCSSLASDLVHAVDQWVDQAATWKPIERWSIINIANEWGPSNSTTWRDSYITAIRRMRAAGYL